MITISTLNSYNNESELWLVSRQGQFPSNSRMKNAVANTSTSSLSKPVVKHSARIQRFPDSIIIPGLQQKARDMHAVPRPVKRLLCSLSIVALFGLCITTYFVFFHRGSASSILEQNQAQEDSNSLHSGNYEYFDDGTEDKALKSPAGSVHLWNAFIRKLKLVSIGDIYDTCGE